MAEKKKSVLITTNEPSPYMDVWFKEIHKHFELRVIYDFLVHPLHPWKVSDYYPGELYGHLSVVDIFKRVRNSDFVLVCGWLKPKFFLTIICAMLLRKKVAMYTDHPFHPNKYAGLVKKYFLYRKLSYIFCATTRTCEYVRSKYGIDQDKVVFFPYGINTDVPFAKAKPHEGINILIASNFYYRKGYSVLFDALKMLDQCDDKGKYHIKIVGVGEELDYYSSIASHLDLDIELPGWVEKKEYSRLMEETDVYIHPSIEEPFGIPPVDAMCMGKVVIVCDGVMSLNGIIKHGVNGYRYPSPTADDKAAEKLYDLLRCLDKSQFEEIGRNGRNDAVRLFSVSESVERLKKIVD